jgi:hypothetical protein
MSKNTPVKPFKMHEIYPINTDISITSRISEITKLKKSPSKSEIYNPLQYSLKKKVKLPVIGLRKTRRSVSHIIDNKKRSFIEKHKLSIKSPSKLKNKNSPINSFEEEITTGIKRNTSPLKNSRSSMKSASRK